jgi:cyclohexyl-isocyanide hydratase
MATTGQSDISRAFRVGMLLFPGMTNLDFAAPLEVFARMPNAVVHVLGKTLEPILTDIGTLELPNMRMVDAPPLDLLFIGGGPGVNALMEDEETVGFLAARAPQALWITSVCTGALVLGAAGLLNGYRAATHWTAMDVLPHFGAQPVAERVVIDRNRITGGGVTAGIDFALTVAAQIYGEERARAMQLGMEYAPDPPFDSGSPRTASAELVALVANGAAALTLERHEIARRVSRHRDWSHHSAE